MSRLIDVDELLTRIRLNYNNHQNVSAGAIKDIIDTTKTAYDVEKVVAELEKLLGDTNFEKATSEVNESYCNGLSYAYGDAINIVRKGGIE